MTKLGLGASREDAAAAVAARDERLRAEWAAWREEDRRLNNDLLVAGRPRGLGPADAGAVEVAELAGITFVRTTEQPTVDAETYTSADGKITLHQSRKDGTWFCRLQGWGSMGFRRHAAPEDALAPIVDLRARNTPRVPVNI